MSPPERLDEEAKGRTDRAIATGDVRLLEVQGTPVAMTAINARLPDMVQIGGVFTPPDLRGRGHARQVVAAHLVEARAEGVKTAILFASGPAACRAYEAIGFERIGCYSLAILKNPVTLEAA
nr:GNAT family N-acetyltransferase [Aliiroseovarius subalbicans]